MKDKEGGGQKVLNGKDKKSGFEYNSNNILLYIISLPSTYIYLVLLDILKYTK